MRIGSMFQISAGLVLAAVTGCSAAPDEPANSREGAACEPMTSAQCVCDTGLPGAQMCGADGFLLPCDCGGSTGAGAGAATGAGAAPPVTGSGGTASTGTGGSSAVTGTGGTPPVTGAGGTPPTTGTGGSPPVTGTGGSPPGTGGAPPVTGTGGMPPVAGTGGSPPGTGGAPPVLSGGTCCSDGDCLCHGPDPTMLTSSAGPFNTDQYAASTGTIYYPTDAEPPFAAIALCGGFLNTGPEMAGWGPFYASHGIVTLITSTLGSDFPDVRATKLLASVDELKSENTNPSSPLSGKLAGRYGTSGYSMGGGGTTIASTQDPSLFTSVGLAAWGPATSGINVPTLLLCGASDTTAPCNMTQGAYSGIPDSVPKMMVSIPGATHFSWFGPTDAGNGISGATALAFQKVYLEGDERWKPLLLRGGGTQTTNIH